jgi:hypothetical protein
MIAAEYYDLCAAHDWYYEHRGHRRWLLGKRDHTALLNLAFANPDFQAIYDAWHAHAFGGEIWGTPEAPRPERPAVVTFPGDAPTVHPDQLRIV